MSRAMPILTWGAKARPAFRTELLSALSFRGLTGADLAVGEGFLRWRDLAVRVRENRRVRYFIGNGASTSLASHFSTWPRTAHVHTQVFSDPALITAVSNDAATTRYSSSRSSAWGNPATCWSPSAASGRSANVLRAAETARGMGMAVVTLSALDENNPLRAAGDVNAFVPAAAYGHAETCHAAVLHYWMDHVAASLRDPAAAYPLSRTGATRTGPHRSRAVRSIAAHDPPAFGSAPRSRRVSRSAACRRRRRGRFARRSRRTHSRGSKSRHCSADGERASAPCRRSRYVIV